MTSLPIIGNTPKPPGNVANTAQTNSTADSQAMKGPLRGGGVNSAVSTPRPVYWTVDCLPFVQPSTGGGLSAFGVSLADTAEPFAALLARQIGEADSSSTNIAPSAITIDGAAPPLKSKQGQAAIAASTPSDQTGTLTAMLLQLPHEMRTPIANDAASTSTATKNADGIDVSARKPIPRTDAQLGMANTALGKISAAAIATDKQTIADAVIKRVELAANLTQPSPNTTRLIPDYPLGVGLAVSTLHERSKDKQDQAAIAASKPSDQTGTLTAMLLQLPHEMRTPIANDAASTSTATKNADGIDVSARKPIPQTDAQLDMANTAPGKTGAAAIATDKQIIADAVSQDAVKRVELAASLTQPSPNTTQLITSSAISAMTPNMLANNRLADTTQSITTPLGNSGWADDFSQKINWMSTQKNQVAELHLNPPDLGPLNVVLKISDNQATALFTSPHSAVREAVENAIPKLREILADNGIMLGNTTVSDQFPRDRSAEGFMNQGSGAAAQRGDFSGAPESTGPSPATAQVVPVRRHNGMVDTFA